MKVHPIVLRRLEVAHVTHLNPRALRVTLTGQELGPFSRDGIHLPGFASPGFDDHVKLVFNAQGPVEEALPLQLDGGIEWTRAPGRQTRDYTPRALRQEPDGSWRLDLDFVLHADAESGSGPAERWARTARPGDPLWIVGPKSSTNLPQETEAVILLADETGLPAVARFFDDPPSAAPVHAILTVATEEARQELAVREQDTVTWILAAPGHPTALVDAVRGMQDSVWERRVYVWGGAESRALLPVRRYLSKVRAVPRSSVDLTGYWHAEQHDGVPAVPAPARVSGSASASTSVSASEQGQGQGSVSGQQGGATAVSTQATTPAPGPELQSPVRWLAVRAALRLGLLEALEDHEASSAQDLATRLKVRADALEGLLPVLFSCGLITQGPAGYALADFGTELLADEHAADEFVGLEADAMLSLACLPDALTSDTPAWTTAHGSSVAQQARQDPEIAEELTEATLGLQFLAPSLAALPVFTRSHVDVAGPGAEAVNAAVTAELGQHPGRRELGQPWPPSPSQLAPTASPLPPDRNAGAGSTDPGRALVLVHALGHLSDAEATLALRAAAGYHEVVVIESTRPDALSPTAAESALLTVALTGTAPRPAPAVQHLAATAGLQANGVAQVGWGREALTFVPAPLGGRA
ncbi:siderophore-interacting protein [Galactobacter caseinivorans]|uniref:Siderophore-interacting protein n=1 Tax=Galactobacter caseinivorans TaxID=2676123 RepID=A0A496PHL7_9MICC|nr:siderophore-interacting protein [Galactobacter caseinivorans]RKW69950.1 siderophore-interacting protein [Galactobacter caseinivorans]